MFTPKLIIISLNPAKCLNLPLGWKSELGNWKVPSGFHADLLNQIALLV